MMGIRRAMLVYQAGIANVFAVKSFSLTPGGRDAVRLIQADFRTCEAFARGMAAARVIVRNAACNQAGDILHANWTDNLEEQPFSDKFCPVGINTILREAILRGVPPDRHQQTSRRMT